MDSLPRKPFVVFYDCCVPRQQFKYILPAVACFAEHLFVRKHFSEKVVRNDRLLFEEVDRKFRSEFPGSLCCLFVTSDGGFENQVKNHPSFAKTVKVVYVQSVNSIDGNWDAAIAFAVKLAEIYGRMRERAHRKSENRERFQEFCRALLDSHFKVRTV